MPTHPDEAKDLFHQEQAETQAAEQNAADDAEAEAQAMNETEQELALLGAAKSQLADLGVTYPNDHDFGPDSDPGVYVGVPEQAYHDHPALSRSVLAEAARMSPMHARHKWKGGGDDVSSDAASLGTALHSRVLTPPLFEERYDVAAEQCEATKGDGDRCSYSAKVRHDGTWYCGTHAPDGEPDDIEVLKADTEDDVESMAEALEADPDAAPLLFELPGLPEVTILWEDEATGLMCKARPDRIVGLPDGVAIVDLKSTRSAHPEDFRRKMSKYGYWLQPPFYTLGIRQASEADVNVKDFVFATVESSEPYATQCFRPHPKEQQAVRKRMCQLIDRIAQCESEDRWPSYSDGIDKLGLKRYEKERLGIDAS